ncbi:hypothetical protein FZ934_04240 [Rhizobium grahamii]|uniref:Uncharacterized protein n=1 Tax=Rhizobium grahamii TaxID=1120045 RepID=A0A5Q0C722_9HYPH|nr:MULTISPECIES: hypothetical protein [Rhizobium]QFY59711.1 hypothetical protein FZ934_04240 [Rhizobium grahamii]QRM51176.1 hypothetical protein F3Y33_18650 [Rhizobium sp. BG6]
MKRSLKGRLYRSFGWHAWANQADEDAEEGRLLIEEHRKQPIHKPTRKISYAEIMSDLATGKPGRFLDRKVQALISSELWPPTSLNETYDQIKERGVDNAWTTSVRGVEHLLMVAHPSVFSTIRLEFSPHRATFAVDGSRYQVKGQSAAMAMMGVHIAMNCLRYEAAEEIVSIREWITPIVDPSFTAVRAKF